MHINVNVKSRLLLSITMMMIMAGCDSDTEKNKLYPIISRDSVKDGIQADKVPQVSKISLDVDSSYLERFKTNPYSQLTTYIREAYSPDQDLYNTLFEAAMNKQDSVDISRFALTPRKIMDTASSLYEQAGMQLYYVKYINWSKDYKRILFQYHDTTDDDITKVQSEFYKQMNHLLYNVAPQHYTDYQKFFAVYDHISRHANYSDNMNDTTKSTAHSILTKDMGICSGFAALFDLVLNHVGVPSKYISNVAHAWNIVELGGERYHTDLTWGASYKGSMDTINSALMSDTKRREGLEYAGLNNDPSIVGFPRENPIPPKHVTSNRYDFLANIYGTYALDIDNGWIYYSLGESIERIKMDGTNKETVWNQPAYNLAYFDDTLYFSGIEPKNIYKMKDMAKPVLLDDQIEIYEIKIQDGILYYGDSEGKGKRLDLNNFSTDDFNDSDIKKDHLKVPEGITFSIKMNFDTKMNTEILPKNKVGMVTDTGKSLPLHMFWSNNGRTLTVRSKTSEVFQSKVLLYVEDGIETTIGEKTRNKRIVEISAE